MVAGALALLCVSCSSTPAMAAELYTSDGFAKQIDTYKDLALSSSNAIKSKLSSLFNSDDNISVASSVGSVTNTISYASARMSFFSDTGYVGSTSVKSDGSFSYIVPSGYTVKRFELVLRSSSLPSIGKYRVSVDFSSDTDLGTYSNFYWFYRWSSANQADRDVLNGDFTNLRQSSGDYYYYFNLDLASSISWCAVASSLNAPVSSGGAIGGKYSISFSELSSSASTNVTTPGTAPSDTDIQSGIASSTSQIASSTNQIYESIIALTQHISDQLAALWDQMYNFMHVPTYNKLQEILLSIQNISMGSDLQKIADQISNSTAEQTDDLISNANSNQEKTDQAIQKHGNFIIDGLKSLFIPSDEYFKSWFDEMYSFFHDRLGFLMLPIDILIKFVNMFQSAEGGFSGVPFPEFKWIDGTVIIPSQMVQFDFLATEWGKDIQAKLYFVGDVIMIGALLALMHRKMEEVLRS